MDEQQTPGVAKALENLSERDLGKIKVCIVEDDQVISQMVAIKLTDQGCIPYTVGDGSEAIATAKHLQPDVVILDLMLPGMPGEEVITRMKQDEELKHIPIIVFSNKSEDESVQKLLALGAERYYVKATTDINELVADLKKIAESKAS